MGSTIFENRLLVAQPDHFVYVRVRFRLNLRGQLQSECLWVETAKPPCGQKYVLQMKKIKVVANVFGNPNNILCPTCGSRPSLWETLI